MNDELVVLEQDEWDGLLAVRLRGEIDLSNVDRVQERLDRCVEGRRHVVLDLTEVEYLDSQGLRLLSRLATRLAAAGVMFEVVAPQGSVVRNVLDLTRMSDDLQLRDAPRA